MTNGKGIRWDKGMKWEHHRYRAHGRGLKSPAGCSPPPRPVREALRPFPLLPLLASSLLQLSLENLQLLSFLAEHLLPVQLFLCLLLRIFFPGPLTVSRAGLPLGKACPLQSSSLDIRLLDFLGKDGCLPLPLPFVLGATSPFF